MSVDLDGIDFPKCQDIDTALSSHTGCFASVVSNCGPNRGLRYFIKIHYINSHIGLFVDGYQKEGSGFWSLFKAPVPFYIEGILEYYDDGFYVFGEMFKNENGTLVQKYTPPNHTKGDREVINYFYQRRSAELPANVLDSYKAQKISVFF